MAHKTLQKKDPDVAVIGGGAAGMMAAVALKQACPAAAVTLFEKNNYLGAKVMISGGGRCNVTTGVFDVKKLLENYPRGAKFLMTAMFGFSPEKVMEWFEEHGVPLKMEDDLRAFPQSDRGEDVVDVLAKTMRELGIKIVLEAKVVDVVHEKGFQVKLAAGDVYDYDAVIITTGGNAYRHTGSTGDGYAFAKKLGHTITSLAPSLHSFVADGSWLPVVSGIAFKRASFILNSFDKAKTYKRTGAFLFTHRGVTGPAIFALSALAAYEPFAKEKPLSLSINFFPDETSEVLEKRLQKLMDEHGKKRIDNLLDFLLPQSLCAVVLQKAGLPSDITAARVYKEQRKALVLALQHFEIKIIGRGAGDEFVTAGGVDLAEVDSRTMASKICSGLYFAGEILNIDGFTGGFNLQASWATGYLAGTKLAIALDTIE